MNKYINRSYPDCPLRYQPDPINKQISPVHVNSLKNNRQANKISPNYLDSQMPSAQDISKARKKQQIKGYRPAIFLKQAFSLKQKKKAQRKIRKRLIVQDLSNSSFRKNSLSISLEKKKTEPSEPKIYSFSSQKKTNLKGGFQVCSPPKKSFKCTQEKLQEYEGRCQLIKSILKRFKEQQNIVDDTDDSGSPCISSLNLKDRLIQGMKKGKNNDNIKFIGRRGCPLNKLSRQYLARREKGQCNGQKAQIQKNPLNHQQISPWHTD